MREKNSQISILSSHHKLIMLLLNKEESMQNMRIYLLWESTELCCIAFPSYHSSKSLILMLCIINKLLHVIIRFPLSLADPNSAKALSYPNEKNSPAKSMYCWNLMQSIFFILVWKQWNTSCSQKMVTVCERNYGFCFLSFVVL